MHRLMLLHLVVSQLLAAIISAAVPNDGSRGWTSFVLLIVELNIIVWVGYYSDRNAGNAVKELKVSPDPRREKLLEIRFF
jgi:hypothetical protein